MVSIVTLGVGHESLNTCNYLPLRAASCILDATTDAETSLPNIVRVL